MGVAPSGPTTVIFAQKMVTPAGVAPSGPTTVIFAQKMVTPAGVEPAIFWMRTRRPGPLDEGANTAILAYF